MNTPSTPSKPPMRFRHFYLGVGGFLVVLIHLLADPDLGLIKNLPFGAGILSTLIVLAVSVLYVGALHFARKALLDYIDLEEVYKKATQTSTGAGLVFVGVGVMMVAVAIAIIAAVK